MFSKVMRHYVFFSLYILLCIDLFISGPSSEGAETQMLSLSDALSTALQKNSLIRFSRLGENISENELNIQKSIYIPSLKANASSQYTNVPTLQDYTEQANNLYQLSASAKNTIGGTSSLNFMTRKDMAYLSSGPSAKEYTSEVFLRYEQPLLKGFGRDVTNLEIDKATLNKDWAFQLSEDVKSQILFNVYRDYFSLYRMTEELRLKREIRKNTEEIFEMVREKVEARVLPITELKTVEAMLSIQDKQILDLVNKRRQQENQLMLSIQNKPLPASVEDIVLLSGPDNVVKVFPEPEPSVTRKKMEEMDIELIRHANELALIEKDKLKAVNDLKPDLVVSLEAGIDGLDTSSATRSIGNISSRNYRTLIMGTLTLPVKNTAAQSSLAEKENKIEQVEIQISNRKNEIRKTADELFTNIETVRRKIELDRKIVALTKENLDNEIERLMRGKSTALNTFDYQTNFINARLDMLNTNMEYIMLIGSYYVYMREMGIFAKAVH